MANLITSGIRSIDFFGVKPKLTIDTSPKYKTVLGGFISILVFALICAGFIHFGQELVKKENPTVILSSLFQTDPEAYALAPDSFNFFIGLQDSNANYYIDPTVIKLSIEYNAILLQMINGTANWVQTTQDLNPGPCDLNKNFPYFQDEFINQPLSSLYCVDPSAFNNISLAGNWGQNTFSYIKASVQICKNSTDSEIICKTPDEINSVLSGGYFVVDFIDTLFEPGNYTTSKKNFLRDTYTTMSNKFYKEVNYYFKNVEYISDRGVLLEDISTEHYLQLDHEKELYDFRSSTTGVIIDCVFRMSNQKDIYTRKYIKIQDVLAQVGGLVKAIMIVVQILYGNFSKVGYYFHLWENMFVVDDSEKEEKDLSNFGSNNLYIHRHKLENSSISLPIVNPNSQLRVSKTLIEKKFDKKKTTVLECFKLGLCLCLISTKKKRNKAFNKLNNYIETKSDFKRVLLSQEKLEVIKEILLTRDQIHIFDFYTHKIDLNRNHLVGIPDHPNVQKSYDALIGTKQNKLGERLKLLFEKQNIIINK